MWIAAGYGASTPVMDWLCETTASFSPLQFNGGSVEIQEAARLRWNLLRVAMRTWGIAQPEDLTIWLKGMKGVQVHKLAVISLREHRNLYCPKGVATTPEWVCWMLSTSRPRWNWGAAWLQWKSPEKPERRHGSREWCHTPHIQHWRAVGLIWTTLIWKKCSPNEECFRNSFRTALEERYLADHEGEELAEERAWKLFALVPMMLLHRVQGTGRVGRDELAARGDLFTRGRWRELIDFALKVEVPTSGKREVLTEDQRRGRAAQDKGAGFPSSPRTSRVSFGPQDSGDVDRASEPPATKSRSERSHKK